MSHGRQQGILRDLINALPDRDASYRTVARLALVELDRADATTDEDARADHLRTIRDLLDALLYPDGGIA